MVKIHYNKNISELLFFYLFKSHFSEIINVYSTRHTVIK